MKPPKSRLLARLDAALAKTRHPVDHACLRAERAGFLARLGHFDEARAVIASLHGQFDHHPNPAVSAWLSMAEGWMLHFGSMSGGARDKLKRAQALSTAAGLTQLQALSSAWLAHMDYVANDMEDMVRNVSLALKLASADNHSARARASMVVALAYDFAGRTDRAQPWYIRVRDHATTDGDETTLSALNYNISSHRVHHAMQAAIFGGDAIEQARQALVSTEATGNFDAWVGTVALDALLPMHRACIASIQGQYGEALALYEKHLDDARKQGLGRLASNYLADMAWCRWHLGDVAGARRDTEAAAEDIDIAMHTDDRAMAHGRLASLFKLLDDTDAAQRHAVSSRDCWAEHRKVQASVIEALEAASLHP
jgi:tetratricopeptide (TPR) repeat protein